MFIKKALCILLMIGSLSALFGCGAKPDKTDGGKKDPTEPPPVSDTQTAAPVESAATAGQTDPSAHTEPDTAEGYGDPNGSGDDAEDPTETWLKPTVTANYENDTDLPAASLLVTAEDTEYSVRIVLATDVPVRDFRILRLTDPVFGEDGSLSFTEELVYNAGTLTPERPVILITAFHGDLPNNAIAYTDETGAARRFTLEISGMDGSLMLS